ncbi:MULTISPECIES: HAMP domain-containing sensor histidine kinase [unclassified Ruegeria]|uniref:sensor histidine kinase n=1 Tax=unclassified Ruegeria TaxID=2625375 RepID=UPI001AD9D743|nr:MULTISPECIES: HAMP domain-containing sensor histidine kinase [unclassified Ruegeria]MBO9411675.1 HAMP domain-containing histidine kinase [Ruegeria sp. R8_1]MBO9415763.1 HAMP domain-containing histidine kinase [Ruegeria sp. R8_2]
MLSLRERALLGGVATGAISVAVGTLAVLSYINSRVSDQFDSNLRDRHTQLVVGLSVTTDNPDALQDLMFDPAYGTPYSGRYWQVTNEGDEVFTSASLFDETIAEPVAATASATFWNTTGPEGEALRSIYQEISYEDGTVWGVSVAESRNELIAERRAAQRSLLPVFTLVGLIGVAGSLLLVSAIMGPLRKLRTDVAHRWDTDEGLKPDDYPDEVSPLVDDLNKLSRRNRDIVSGSRRQTADLAHALKTPTAILRNELSSLAEHGATIDTAQEALDRIDAQLSRSLARMRAMNTAELSHSRADLSNSVDRLSRLFSRMAERDGKEFEVIRQKNLWVRMDPQDIEEVLGNLMDNAVKWCRQTVRVSAMAKRNSIEIHIEDDGPGIPEDDRREALRSGGRLDTSVAGTGLGLAIAVDLLNAYGAKLDLGSSKALGGLECRVVINSMHKKP